MAINIDDIPGAPRTWAPRALRAHIDNMEKQALYEDAKARLENVKSKLGRITAVSSASIGKVLGDIRKARSVIARTEAVIERQDTLIKSMKKQLKADNLRKVLRRSELFRKSAGWRRMTPEYRRSFDAAERECRKALAKIEAQQRSRHSLERDAEKSRRAMLDRGVTFHRMVALNES